MFDSIKNLATRVIHELDLQALVDNCLPAEEAAVLRAKIANNAVLLKRYNDLVAQKHLLQAWWAAEQQTPTLH